MLQIFQSSNSMLKELQTEFSGGINLKNCWVHLTNPTDKESELIIRTTGIPEDMLKAALDEEERARIEYDDGCTLVLFDIPIIEEESSYFSYTTMPLAAIITQDSFVTVCLKENSIVHQFINGRIKNLDTGKRDRFLYMLLYATHIKFLQYLKQIDKSSQRIQHELHRSTKNKELIQLLDLENSLVYFSTSLRANSIIIEKLLRMDNKKVEEDTELLEDVAIENRQAIEMSNIFREILSGTMDAYASVISNNLNIIMKVLTTLTAILAVPTLIASYWGMNTGVPFEGKSWGFWVVFGISLVLTGACAFFITKGKTFRPRK